MCALWQPTGTTEYALVGDGSTMDLLAGNDPVSELLLETKSPEGLWLRDASSSSAAGEGDGEDEPGPVDEATWRASLAVRLGGCRMVCVWRG